MVDTVIEKIKKVLRLAKSLIGRIVFTLIAVILIGVLVYIIATTILKSVARILGISDPRNERIS